MYPLKRDFDTFATSGAAIRSRPEIVQVKSLIEPRISHEQSGNAVLPSTVYEPDSHDL
jgi:hypothetical protein